MKFNFRNNILQMKRSLRKKVTFCTVICLEMLCRSSESPNLTGRASPKSGFFVLMGFTFIIESTKRETRL